MILGGLPGIGRPSGTVQELVNVTSTQFLTVTEPGGEPRTTALRVIPSTFPVTFSGERLRNGVNEQ